MDATTAAKILELATIGLPQTTIATLTGTSDGYVSQIVNDPENSRLIASKRMETRAAELAENAEINKSYVRIEKRLLTKLEQAIPAMYKPGEILHAIKIVNGAKRHEDINDVGRNAETAPQVTLVMPTFIQNNFLSSTQVSTNANNEVIEVGGRNLTTIAANKLLGLVKETENENPDNPFAK